MLKYSDLKEQAIEELEEGVYTLEIVDIIQETNQDGDTKFVMTHDIVGTNRKINYDTYKILDAQGRPLAFGTSKLKKLLDSTETTVDEIDIKVLKAVLPKRKFKANIVLNEKGYPQINYTDIYPVDIEKAIYNGDAKAEEDTSFPPEDDKKIDVNDL